MYLSIILVAGDENTLAKVEVLTDTSIAVYAPNE